MNKHFFTILILFAGSTLFVTGCSETSGFASPSTTGGVSDVKTQIADQNSLTIIAEKIAVEALNYGGETMKVTVYAADRNNNPVPDNTAIRFLTNGGAIEPQCLTTDGLCQVTWTDQDPVPASKVAIVLAYTKGEESFTDLNDNGLYDAGEPFTDISEPFFDLDDNDIRDANTEEFVDANNDNIFDVADGLFTGTPCIGDNTVCNRVTTLIWKRRDVILSSSFATIAYVSGAFSGSDETATTFKFNITDGYNHPMPDGTTVKVEASGGTVANASIALAAGQETITVRYTTGTPAGGDSITLTVETPNGNQSVESFD